MLAPQNGTLWCIEDTFDGMTGHVPTAINHFFGHLFTQEGPRNDEELRKIQGYS